MFRRADLSQGMESVTKLRRQISTALTIRQPRHARFETVFENASDRNRAKLGMYLRTPVFNIRYSDVGNMHLCYATWVRALAQTHTNRCGFGSGDEKGCGMTTAVGKRNAHPRFAASR